MIICMVTWAAWDAKEGCKSMFSLLISCFHFFKMLNKAMPIGIHWKWGGPPRMDVPNL